MYYAENFDPLDTRATNSVMMHFCAPKIESESGIDLKMTRSATQDDLPFEGQLLKTYVWGGKAKRSC